MAVCHRHLLLLALLLASSAVARAEDISPPKVPRFEPAPCPKLAGAEELAKASCFYLVVPENRSRPNGRTIRLMVAKYPARSAEKRPDPVVYLAGGPGDIAPLEVNGLIAAGFIRDRDVYVVSQRGTMFSEPALTCAANDDLSRELLGMRFYSEATKRAHLAATEACHRELAATGADLSAYNSTESAADFADLRKVLGFEAWNVYGTSYGSYLAQTLMRDHPEGIRSVVLDFGVADDLHRRRKLAERERRLRQYLPSLRGGTGLQRRPSSSRGNLHRIGRQARGRSADGNRQGPGHRRRHRSRHRRRSPDRLAAQPELWRTHAPSCAWIASMGSPPAAPTPSRRLPSIGQVAHHRPIRPPPPSALGSPYGVSCRESYPFATPEDLAAAGRKAFPDYPLSVTREGIGGWAYFNEDCRDVWKVPAAPEAMHQPVASSLPTLLISGSFDTLTSLAGAKAAAAKLSHATIISIPGIGHFVSPASPCAQDVIVSFLADPAAPDTSCVGALKPQAFTVQASP